MARNITSLPAERRIADSIRLSVIAEVFPLSKVREALTEPERAGTSGIGSPLPVEGGDPRSCSP